MQSFGTNQKAPGISSHSNTASTAVNPASSHSRMQPSRAPQASRTTMDPKNYENVRKRAAEALKRIQNLPDEHRYFSVITLKEMLKNAVKILPEPYKSRAMKFNTPKKLNEFSQAQDPRKRQIVLVNLVLFIGFDNFLRVIDYTNEKAKNLFQMVVKSFKSLGNKQQIKQVSEALAEFSKKNRNRNDNVQYLLKAIRALDVNLFAQCVDWVKKMSASSLKYRQGTSLKTEQPKTTPEHEVQKQPAPVKPVVVNPQPKRPVAPVPVKPKPLSVPVAVPKSTAASRYSAFQLKPSVKTEPKAKATQPAPPAPAKQAETSSTVKTAILKAKVLPTIQRKRVETDPKQKLIEGKLKEATDVDLTGIPFASDVLRKDGTKYMDTAIFRSPGKADSTVLQRSADDGFFLSKGLLNDVIRSAVNGYNRKLSLQASTAIKSCAMFGVSMTDEFTEEAERIQIEESTADQLTASLKPYLTNLMSATLQHLMNQKAADARSVDSFLQQREKGVTYDVAEKLWDYRRSIRFKQELYKSTRNLTFLREAQYEKAGNLFPRKNDLPDVFSKNRLRHKKELLKQSIKEPGSIERDVERLKATVVHSYTVDLLQPGNKKDRKRKSEGLNAPEALDSLTITSTDLERLLATEDTLCAGDATSGISAIWRKILISKSHSDDSEDSF